ncbi:MAG: DUF3857 domain-containing protein [Myxococcales bacterium]|nr:DUF3857 domain-containing protein [Myxococcales bacterium]
MNSRPTLRKAWIPLLGAIVLCTLSGPPAAYGQRRGRNPFDARVQGFVRDAERAGPSPAAILPILRLSNEWVDASPGLVRRQLERLASSRRLSPPMRVHAAVLAAIQRARQGEVLEADRELDALGFVRDVHVIGGFDNEGRQGYGRLLPPEQLQDRIVDDAIEYPGRERPIHWRPYPDIIRRGYVDLDAILRPNVNVCGFVETFVRVERARPLTIWLGGGGANKLYFNGALVLDDPVYRSPDIDRAVALVGARPGWNRVLVKSCVTDMAWGVYLRLGEADGSPAQGLELASRPRGPLAPAPAEPPRLGASPQAPLAFFEAAVREHPEDAGALFDLARFLRWTGAEDVTEGRARQLAQRAAELEPNVERLLFAAALAETRAERMRYSEQAKALAPRDPRVLLYDAGLVALGPDPDRALRLVQQIPDGSVEGVAGRRLEAALLSSLGLPRAAGSRLHAAAAASAGSLRALHLEHQVQSSLGHVQAAHEQLERIVEAQPDDVSARRGLLDDALERGESDRVEAQLQAMLEIAPGDAGTLYYVASIYDAMGREDDSLELIRRVAELIPDEADVHVQLGNAYLRYGREDAAAASLRRALVLRPQDAATRQRLERLRPAVRADEAYATSIEEILTRRGEGDGWSATILHDLTVNTVFENGLGSSFHQIAFQVHDEEGARRRDHYSVRYEPGAQWVDLRSAKIHRADGTIVEAVRTFVQPLAAAGYRIYYDASALVISLLIWSPATPSRSAIGSRM